MAKVTVYRFETWDPLKRAFVRSARLATREAIEAAEAVILPETAQEVDVGLVGKDGIVRMPEGGTSG